MHDWSFDFLRRQIVGIDSAFDTPFGRRLMVYCDYTASGRCLMFVERYLQTLQRVYANTHTEDDLTGRSMSRLLHEAEGAIKRSVNAGPQGRIIACGTGATGAIDKLQQILGVYLPPATRRTVGEELREFLGVERFEAFRRQQESRQPVVFVGPYEHHSNEVTWRQGLATVVEVNLAADGGVDLAHLEQLLRRARVPRAAQDRLVLGGLERDGHALAGARDRAPAARARRLRLLRFRRERALRRDRHESAGRRRGRRPVPRRDLPLAAQVPRRPGVERRAGVQRAPVPARPAAQRRRGRHGGLRESRGPGLPPRHRGAREGRHARRAAGAQGRARDRAQGSHRRRSHRGARARIARPGARALGRERPHRGPRQPRSVAPHRHRLVQPARSRGRYLHPS